MKELYSRVWRVAAFEKRKHWMVAVKTVPPNEVTGEVSPLTFLCPTASQHHWFAKSQVHRHWF